MKIITDIDVINIIKEQNKNHKLLTKSQIISLDRQWINEVNSNERLMIDKSLENTLSHYLKKIKNESNGLHTEIFVMDNKGLNVGQSNITSDYWQGDEAKLQKSLERGKSGFHISNIKYDESSKVFQSQISLTITDPTSGTPIGALTVGIDIEKALSIK